MKKLHLAFAAAFIALASPAAAQQTTVKICTPTSGTACPLVTASAPLPVTGTFSATLAGFTPNGNYGSLTATAASSASTALPAGTVVGFQNLSTVDVSCVLTAGASTATANKIIVRGGATVFVTVGSNTTTACINQTGSASNVVGLMGGAGLGTNFGGGSSGGGGAITMASGAVASGAYSAGSLAAGAGVDGWDLTQGAKADAACGTATGTCSVVALLKYLNTVAGTAVPLTVNGTATGWTGLTPGVAQTGTIVAGNVDLTSVGGTAIGAMANYGTSPGAVKAIGVNAFVTNTVTANLASAATGGASVASGVAANSNNSTSIKGSAGTVYSLQTSNINASTAYFIKLYDKATAPTCGTDTPVARYVIPPSNGGNNVTIPVGKAFTLGIGMCIVTGIADNDNTSVPAATILYNVDYK